jgi:hypothetical protein
VLHATSQPSEAVAVLVVVLGPGAADLPVFDPAERTRSDATATATGILLRLLAARRLRSTTAAVGRRLLSTLAAVLLRRVLLSVLTSDVAWLVLRVSSLAIRCGVVARLRSA